jgi:hypothetical protein
VYEIVFSYTRDLCRRWGKLTSYHQETASA